MPTRDSRHDLRRKYRARRWPLFLDLSPILFYRRSQSVVLLIIVSTLLVFWTSASWRRVPSSTAKNEDTSQRPGLPRPGSAAAAWGRDPEQWLVANSNNRYAYNTQSTVQDLLAYGLWSRRPRAALISLVRNEELDGIMQSMRQLEYHWNHKYRYPWIFFNEQPFTDAFKVSIGSHPRGTAG